VSSHFGAFDCASFPKDRAFYYQSIFSSAPMVHVLPHWSFTPGATVPPIWVYTNGDEAEAFVNGVSIGRKPVPRFSHAEWAGVTFEPGSLSVVAYLRGAPHANVTVRTAGAPAGLRLSFHDGVGADGLVTGCSDAALVKVEVVDASGEVVPDAANEVTISLSGATGAAYVAGTASGDATSLVNNKSPTRPVFHGLALGVILAGDSEGTVVVIADSPGLAPAAPLQLPVAAPPAGWAATWCRQRQGAQL